MEDRVSFGLFAGDSIGKEVARKRQLHPSISIFYKRLNVEYLMRSLELKLLRRNLVVTSGSPSMRKAVNEVMSNFQASVISEAGTGYSFEEVYLHNEAFSW